MESQSRNAPHPIVWWRAIYGFPLGVEWLPDMDSNHEKRLQRPLCYRYTIGQNFRFFMGALGELLVDALKKTEDH